MGFKILLSILSYVSIGITVKVWTRIQFIFSIQSSFIK